MQIPLSGRGAGARSWRLRRTVRPWLFLAPLLALLLTFRLAPMLEAVRLSLFRWNGIGDMEWVGLDNYGRLLGDRVFRTALLDNGLILLSLPIWVLLPLLIALALRQRIPGWRVFRLVFFLPSVISPVVIGAFFELMLRYDGPMNTALRWVGLGGLAHQWLAEPATALPVMVAIIIWANFGVGVLIYLAGLATMDTSLYDAARVDGANWWQMHRAVTIPDLRPVIEFYAVIVVIGSFASLFPYVYTLTRGGPGYATYTVEYDIYQAAFGQDAIGYASAVGVALLVVILAIVLAGIRAFHWRQAR
jgi:ABC-type sugar transport system permease subunit